MTRVFVPFLLVLLACTKRESFDDLKLEPPPPELVQLPPPPPPPPPPGPTPPPAAIASFIAADDSSDPWGITVDKQRLSDAETRDLLDRLVRSDSYWSGAYGCSEISAMRVTLQRGERRLTLEVDCGNVSLDGAQIATLSVDAAAYFQQLRSAPAAPRMPPRIRSR